MPSTHDLASLSAPTAQGTIELVIDLSNVCRNSAIPPHAEIACWGRVLSALDAWSRWEFGSERPVVRLVADESLITLLSKDDRRAFREAVNDGYAETVDYADPRILDLAEEHGSTVLTNDQFVGLRRERPWLDGNATQFVQVVPTGDDFELSLVRLNPRTDFSMSRAEERDEMKDLKIDIDRKRGVALLDSIYRCDKPSCMRRAFMPDQATMPPKNARDGNAVCPGCGQPLTNLGSRVDTAVLKLAPASGGDEARVPVPKGSTVCVGRSSTDLSLKTLLSDDDLKRISREHVIIAFDGRNLTVEDRGSTNGTTVERWDRTDRSHSPPIRLASGTRERLGPRDRLLLGGTLRIERSGRRYPFELGAPAIDSQQSSPPTMAE